MTRLLAIVALLCSAQACKKGSSACGSDVQCPARFACDDSTGACRCIGDASCGATESCNAAGFCQPRLRCDSTSDCAQGSICDSVSGVCIPERTCTSLDVQCRAGEVCKDFACQPGCRHDGDCASASDVCRPCPPGTPPSECPVGARCVRGKCDTQLTCHYGDLCADDGAGDKVCTPDERGPYCQPCTRAAGAPDYCPDATGFGNGNFCLIDTSKPLGQATFCGVACDEGQACPNGYGCRDVRWVTGVSCSPDQGLAACSGTATDVACDPAKNHAGSAGGLANDDCDAALLVGAVCDPAKHKCVPQCLSSGETSVVSFCSCVEDTDCPQDQCGTGGRCSLSGRPCINDGTTNSCAVTCVKRFDPRLGAVGICLAGRNCAPAQGYTCDTLLGKQP